jgi:hypothetical protein
MVGQLRGGKALAAQSAVVDGTIRVTGNLSHFAVFSIDQNPATPMAHAAMAFDHGIITVDFHFPFDIRKFEFRPL